MHRWMQIIFDAGDNAEREADLKDRKNSPLTTVRI